VTRRGFFVAVARGFSLMTAKDLSLQAAELRRSVAANVAA
jgi:hypothetical protein